MHNIYNHQSSMKLHAINEGKIHIPSRKKTPKIASLVALTLFFTIVPIYYPYFRYAFQKPTQLLLPSPIDVDHHQASSNIPISTTLPKHPLYRSQQDPEPIPIVKEQESRPEELPEKQETGEKVVVPEKKGRRRRGRKKRRHRIPVVKESLQRPSGGESDDPVNEIIENEDDDGINYNNNNKSCDLFSGEWVENPDGPYYTNTTCWAIQEHQNCMKFGRPDRGFLKWKWKPYNCQLPVFDPTEFLEVMRGKSLAFVGDSVARNHMQSLICLLSRVTYPKDVSTSRDENFKRWEYQDYDFNISIFWSPYLVRTERSDPKDVTKPFRLYLDEFDESWTTQIEDFDYVIISAGHWFFRPTMFYSNRRVIGCLYCSESNITHRRSNFSYRRAWRTAFRAIYSLTNFKGIAILRTFAPSHFEGGYWDKGGDCRRTRPFRSNETVMEDFSAEMYNVQMQEYRIGEREGRRRGIKLKLMDMTQVMQLRPDGHPSRYGHWPVEKREMPNDCVHWCLPGPIDTWNDFLLELLKKEDRR